MEIKLRKAVLSDVEQIAKIHVDSWEVAFEGLMPENYIKGYTLSARIKEWQETIQTNAEFVVVAESASTVVGFMSYRVHPVAREIIELSKLYLCPTQYGKGMGSLFMRNLENAARDSGVRKIHLYVLNNNATAIQFYTKHGFENADGFVSEEFEGTTIIDVLMTKRVS
ncbi:GNAT family N-acetyltransferase [Grimontia indica]|nr:GNAT family N-acetyltransferase [Grimontia indica]